MHEGKLDAWKARARMISDKCEEHLRKGEAVTWEEIFQHAESAAAIYKLTLKELRLRGYDIGNRYRPYVIKFGVQPPLDVKPRDPATFRFRTP